MFDAELSVFPVVVELDVAWGDMDSYGHVNNVVYFRYFEQARIAYLERIGWLRLKEECGLGPIVAATSARYRKPLFYPDHLWVGAQAVNILTDRIRLRYRLISRRHQSLAAEGEVLVVSYDYHRGHKVPLPEVIRQAINTLEKHSNPDTTMPSAP
ncbi:MAG: acyl-CoA thioesterase [Gemmataceae bacterium]|nr:acyl-CoA thioesterase [Gemmataceae bacterium]MDW8243565.1 thioesterase family protein [Thermogemmata sp.]